VAHWAAQGVRPTSRFGGCGLLPPPTLSVFSRHVWMGNQQRGSGITPPRSCASAPRAGHRWPTAGAPTVPAARRNLIQRPLHQIRWPHVQIRWSCFVMWCFFYMGLLGMWFGRGHAGGGAACPWASLSPDPASSCLDLVEPLLWQLSRASPRTALLDVAAADAPSI
jgi:hypothetical protein